MTCSPERLAANRDNAQKSTGPKTPEGKATSRRNALKHGLTGQGIALPDEDAAALAERIASFEVDLKPRNDVARVLAQRAALLSVRMERSALNEAAALSRRIERAPLDEALARAEELQGLIARLETEPELARIALVALPEGVDWLIGRWRDLRDALGERGQWTEAQRDHAARLAGRSPDPLFPSPLEGLVSLAAGNAHPLGSRLWPGLPPEARAEAARDALRRLVDAELDSLQADRDGFDLEAIALDRSRAGARALFDPSKEAQLARRYEAAAERHFYKALKEIERINAQPDDDATPEGLGFYEGLASSGRVPPPPRPLGPEPRPRPPESAPISIPTEHRVEPAPYFPLVR